MAWNFSVYVQRMTGFDIEKQKSVAAASFGIALIIVALGMVKISTNRMLDVDSKASATQWADYVASNIEDLGQILKGEIPSAGSLYFLKNAKKFGNVFRYKFYAPDGSLRLIVGEQLQFSTRGQSLEQEKKDLAKNILTGEVHVETKRGKKNGRPLVYSEAYVPVFKDGSVIGVVEVYVDLAKKASSLENAFLWIGFVSSVLIALAFGMPAYLWSRIRNQKKIDEKTRYLAHHDSLTGIPNRSTFIASLEHMLAARKVSQSGLAVLFVDCDGFKQINDQFGHDVGDHVLKQVAARLTKIVEGHGHIGRLGGDEFGVVIENFDTEEQVGDFARRLIDLVSSPMPHGSRNLVIGCSVGVALYPDHGRRNDDLLTHADLAMYRAKSLGRGRACTFDQTMTEELRARRDIEQDLKYALAHDAIELHFQPIVSAKEMNALSGFEALVRVRQRDGTLVAPDRFISIAEEVGLIDHLGELVLEKACRIAADWPETLKLSVNLSPRQFDSGQLPEKIKDILIATGFKADRLVCEVTERLALQDTVVPQIECLKRTGVKISVDDFGVGHSSLSYLWKFGFDHLKLDKSLIDRVVVDSNAANIAKAVIDLSHSLGMCVTAEGIETREQLEIIQSFKCDFVQGYYFSRPIPEIDTPRYVMSRMRPSLNVAHVEYGNDDLSRVGVKTGVAQRT